MVRMPAIFRVETWKLAHVLNVNLKSNAQSNLGGKHDHFSICECIQIPSLGRGEGWV